jgi:filamentous hemagglutinin family protein
MHHHFEESPMQSYKRRIQNPRSPVIPFPSAHMVHATPLPDDTHGELRGLAMLALSAALMLGMVSNANANGPPTNGVVVAGKANIGQNGNTTTITQSTGNVSINWQNFSIPSDHAVRFVQPSRQSVALNRVVGTDPSVIMGSLAANGRVFLVNPNGILFGSSSSVNVGALVASTMSISDADFLAGRYAFTGAGPGSVVNLGTIHVAEGGYVALMGRTVSNQGVISARLGTVALAAGEAATLDVAGDGLLNVSVSQGAVDALVENGGLIRADGGHVLLTAQAASGLLDTVVNNTGVIEARTIQDRGGSIQLMGDMQSGKVTVDGTLDASAPTGGNGGFIETSAAGVSVRPSARVTTASATGTSGSWLIDPHDFTIGSAPGNDISGSTLGSQLVTTSVNITTAGAGADAGDIFINDPVSWTASGAPTTLSLTADRDVHINAAITAVDGNFSVCCGRDIDVQGAISVTRGSVRLAAARDINQSAAITVTDGNLMMCAGNNVNVSGAIALTRGTADAARSLGLPEGLTLSADTDGTGPGIAGGTVIFASGTPPSAVTNAPVNVYYNPISYSAPTDYSNNFTLVGSSVINQRMLVFASGGEKVADGSASTTLTGLKGAPPGVTLVAGAGSSATYDSADPGTDKPISYSGYTLAGANAANYALPLNCCGPVLAHTTGTITAAPPVTTTPPVTTPPVTPTPPVTTPPENPTSPEPSTPGTPGTPGTSTPPVTTTPGTSNPPVTTTPGTSNPPGSGTNPPGGGSGTGGNTGSGSTPPGLVVVNLPPPVAPGFGIVTPPFGEGFLPPPGGPWVDLTPPSEPSMTLVEAPPPVAPPPATHAPYVPPLLPPKPYRN